MIILTVLIVFLLVGLFLVMKEFSGITWFLGSFVFTVSGIILIVAFILLLSESYAVESFIIERDSTEKTYSRARAKGRPLESAAIQKDIAEINRKLASLQYYNQTIFNIWIPDRIDDIKSIK